MVEDSSEASFKNRIEGPLVYPVLSCPAICLREHFRWIYVIRVSSTSSTLCVDDLP